MYKKRVKKIFLFLTLTIFSTLQSQLRPQVAAMVTKLSQAETGDSRYIGLHGSQSETYKLYDSIAKMVTAEESEYLAFNGNPLIKYYFSSHLIDSKSDKLPQLFRQYLKANDSVKTRKGCMISIDNLARSLYMTIYNIPINIRKTAETKASLKNNKDLPDEIRKELTEYDTKWSIDEAQTMIATIDHIALDNLDSPVAMIEYICLINQHYKKKLPYYRKLKVFQKKYESKIIADYIAFCER